MVSHKHKKSKHNITQKVPKKRNINKKKLAGGDGEDNMDNVFRTTTDYPASDDVLRTTTDEPLPTDTVLRTTTDYPITTDTVYVPSTRRRPRYEGELPLYTINNRINPMASSSILDISQISDDNSIASYDSGDWDMDNANLDLTNELQDDEWEIPSFEDEPSDKDDYAELLKRDDIIIEKYKKKLPFDIIGLTGFDIFEQEDKDLCEFIKDKDNLLFIFDRQLGIINRDILRRYIETDTLDANKIVYQCKDLDNAHKPRNENIISGPNLNMNIFGINGVVIPLSYLDNVLNGKHQIFAIETEGDNTMIIASLNTRMGGNVVSADHCQSEVYMKMGKLSYIENQVLSDKCTKGGRKQRKRNTSKSTRKRKSPNRRKTSTKRRKGRM